MTNLSGVSPKFLASQLGAAGIHYAPTVPCSSLAGLIGACNDIDGAPSPIPATCEGEALAMTIGSRLGGQAGAVIMQSSGLGNAVNPLLSLAQTYGVGAFLLIGWRGEPSAHDAAHQESMGSRIQPLLDVLDVHHEVIDQSSTQSELASVIVSMSARAQVGETVALLIRPGAVQQDSVSRWQIPRYLASSANKGMQVFADTVHSGVATDRRTLLETLVSTLNDSEPLIACTGYTSRDLALVADRPANFYMQGSMGYAAALGVGVSLTTSQRTYVVDGDGSMLMHLGGVFSGAALSSGRFTYVLLDNGRHASTGGQPTISSGIDMKALAMAAGYRAFVSVSGPSMLAEAIVETRSKKLPVFIHAPFEESADPKVAGRPGLSPSEIATRFSHQLAETRP